MYLGPGKPPESTVCMCYKGIGALAESHIFFLLLINFLFSFALPIVYCGVIAKGDSRRSFNGSYSLRLLKSSRPLPAIQRTFGCYIL